MGQDDYTSQYNTQLDPVEEAAFQIWARRQNRLNDLYDYDMRGAWKAGAAQADNGHFPDTFKKPNHPTFSIESMYDDPKAPTGGRWETVKGRDRFVASPRNVQNMGADRLRAYFASAEPDVELVVP